MAAAAGKGDLETARLLLDNGAEVNVSDHWGTALTAAASSGKENIALVRLLLAKGADLETKTAGNSNLLHKTAYSGNKEIAALFIEKGVDINALNDWRNTPLHLALSGKHNHLARLLIDSGAVLDIENRDGDTAVSMAIRRGNPGMVRFLLSLHRAVQSGDGAAVEEIVAKYPELMDAGDKQGWTPLHHAVQKRRLNIARILLEKGAKVNKRSKYRRVDLLRGAVGKLLIPELGRTKYYKKVKTPLDIAVETGDKKMAELLKKFGAKE